MTSGIASVQEESPTAAQIEQLHRIYREGFDRVLSENGFSKAALQRVLERGGELQRNLKADLQVFSREAESVGVMETVKVSVNLPTEILEILRQLSIKGATTMTEVLRRSVCTEKMLHDEVAAGNSIILESPAKGLFRGKTYRQLVLRQ